MVNSRKANRQTLVKLLVVSVLMFGFGFALVPFYSALCDALGLNSVVKPDAVANTQVDTYCFREGQILDGDPRWFVINTQGASAYVHIGLISVDQSKVSHC